MPEFVLNRNASLTGKGHRIVFQKGQPTYVPPEMAYEVIGIGAEPVEGDKDAFLPKEGAPEDQLSPADKEALLYAAFDQLTERNSREDFGGDGKPTLDAVKELVKFSITKKEIVSQFQKYRELKAA